ncbi:methyltransferase [Amycolatopsis rubida]|uniref:Methyltransferase n=1 Tax=Amycolatopsis rubida TaxID=112413 RepID=A0A1I5HU35_9PSEU|nr:MULTISPECIES: class I SAM-dependent methyltransferase [Amycolatopsis]MYW90923.1 methyltransferase [Amycolatopsis rubida]NEC55908.1 methyltransferase [Amycolatopsis rubida]OAP26009.1 O-methyltransferase [Amycolatopsis sp. M39]SFO51848.1 Predicted O-methyltransferase YrrM [Amycolatopsis rubida]
MTGVHRPLRDPAVNAVIDKLVAAQQYPADDPRNGLERDPHEYSDYGFSISPEQGDLIYLLCRGIRATRTVEFATSVGLSTLYAAAAVRDNGGGTVIGAELVPAKVAAASRNLAEAGLADYAEIREGDARVTLRDLGGEVDFALIDGWLGAEPSLAREVIELVAPHLRIGGYVLNDNAEPDFLAWIRDPAHGFVSVSLPLHGGTELCVKVAERKER